MSNTTSFHDKSVVLNGGIMSNMPKQPRMSEFEKAQTYQAAAVAMNIINQKRHALDKNRDEALTYVANNPGNHCFNFNMDFMKVTHKLIVGYMRNSFVQSRMRESQISAESFRIAEETGASYQEVRNLFLLLMSKFFKT